MKYSYDLVYLVGDKGVGKTTLLAMFANMFMKRHLVYSNVEIKGTRLYNIKDFGVKTFPPESVILLDEAGIEFNSRSYANLNKKIIKWLKLQRHHRCMLVVSSQTYNDADKVIRDSATYLFYLKKYGNFTIGRRIINELVLVPASNGQQGYLGFDLHFSGLFRSGSLLVCFRPRYYKMFDTYTIDEQLEEIEYIQM